MMKEIKIDEKKTVKKMPAPQFYEANLLALTINNNLLKQLITAVENVKETGKVISAKIEGFTETMRNYTDFISDQVQALAVKEDEGSTFKRTDDRPSTVSKPATPWKESKNKPGQFYCKITEASREDIENARRKFKGNPMWLWTTGDGETLIFKKEK